jgi:putative spermidine/putrescine transport system permease protein
LHHRRTLLIQMCNGVREEMNPAITAAATPLILLAITLLALIEVFRRKSARLCGGHSS